jgi:TPR repeat protein
MKKNFIFFFTLILIPTISFCMEKCVNEAFICGRNYYYSNEYEKAFKYIKMAADNKHPEAQLYLALMYLDGNGCKKDQSEAKRYCNLAKENENQSAYKLWSEILKYATKYGTD